MVSNGYTSKCNLSNRPFLFFDIQALWRSGLSARVPECQKIKRVGYTECFGRLIFATIRKKSVGLKELKCLVC